MKKKWFLFLAALMFIQPMNRPVQSFADPVEETLISASSILDNSDEDYSGYSLSFVGDGIVSARDPFRKNAVNVTDTSSYIEISPASGKALASDAGFSLSFWQRSTTGSFKQSDINTTDDFEQLVGVNDGEGNQAYVCSSGIYFITGKTVAYLNPKANLWALLTTTWKYVTISMDFENIVLSVYINGVLSQEYDNTKDQTKKTVALFKKVLTQNDAKTGLRIPYSERLARNSNTYIFDGVSTRNEYLNPTNARLYFDKKNPDFTPNIIVNNKEGEYTLTPSHAVIKVGEEGRLNAFNFGDQQAKVDVKMAEGASFGSANGFTIDFWQRSQIDNSVHSGVYKNSNALNKYNTDEFEQLFGVVDDNGNEAYICAGGLYYVTGGNITFAFPDANPYILIQSYWKHVILTMDADSIKVIVDGNVKQNYNSSNKDAGVVANVINAFMSVAQKEGGTLSVRKALTSREQRCSSTQVFDSMRIYDHAFSMDEVSNVENLLKLDVKVNSLEKGEYTVAPTGTGIVHYDDEIHTKAINFHDQKSSLAIVAADDKHLGNENGITVSFWQKTTTDTFGNSSKADKETTDDFEQMISATDKDGNSAYVVFGGVYYSVKGASAPAYAQVLKNNTSLLTTTWKYVSVVITPSTVTVYCNGEEFQTNKDVAAVQNTCKVFMDAVTMDGGSIEIRGVCPTRTTRNSLTQVMDAISVDAGALTPTEIKAKYNEIREQSGDPVLEEYIPEIVVTGAQENEIEVSVFGEGVVNAQNPTRENAFGFTDTSSGVEIKANGCAMADETGFSMSFWERTKTDTFNNSNTLVNKNFTDDFEQLITVVAPNGDSAYIDMGGLYYLANGASTATYAFPAANGHSLLTTTWKYVTLNVDFENNVVILYVDGKENQVFDQSNADKTVITNVVQTIKAALTANDSTVYIKKALPNRINRNSVTVQLDDVVIDRRLLSVSEVLTKYDAFEGNVRAHFVPNLDCEIDDVVVKCGTSFELPNESVFTRYDFLGYFSDKEMTVPYVKPDVLNEPVVIYVKLAIKSYRINYHYNGGETVAENPVTYTIDSNGVEILPTSRPGYNFLGWYRTEDFKNSVSYLVPGTYGDIDLYAKFEAIRYSITFDLSGGLLTSDMPDYFSVEDENITLCECWKPGYDFVGFFDENGNKVEVIDAMSTSNIVLTARFVEHTEPSTGDSVAPITSEPGESATPATSEEKKGGCGGSIAAISSVIALISLAGVSIMLKKRGN